MIITTDRQGKIQQRRIKSKNIDSFLKNNKIIRELKVETKGTLRIKRRPTIIASEYSRKISRKLI